MSRRNENWLLVEWSTGGRDVVYSKSVLNPVGRELKIGDVMTVNRRGEAQGATLIARAKERDELEPRPKETPPGPSPKPDDEPQEYSASGSSWAPSDDGNISADSDKVIPAKKIKLEQSTRQYTNRRTSKNVLNACYIVNSFIPKSLQDSSKKNERKRPQKEIDRSGSLHKSLPDSTKRNPVKSEARRMVTIDARELEEIGKSFRSLFNMLEDLKRPTLIKHDEYTFSEQNEENHLNANRPEKSHKHVQGSAKETLIEAIDECDDNDEYEPEEFNRSDDNVLITNRYDNQYNANTSMVMKGRVRIKKSGQSPEAAENEWVPIGSGKTLIHMDQFRKVNWKSYTIATRTLLLAVFPRRILATHSLTGKRSPAFQDKPAKMCLDPKIISDVIMEITDKFDVKENLVRSIITTKCADECKMAKKNKKKPLTSKNQENELPQNFQEKQEIVN